MKLPNTLQKGFTLVELIIVIAIIGVLAAVLITIIDPLDKINSANDSGVVSTLTQVGRSLDNYAAVNSNSFPSGNLNAMLSVLSSNGESRITSYTAPNGYSVSYLVAPNGSCTTAARDCAGYAITATGFKSKRNLSGTSADAAPSYQIVNGRGCFTTTVITQTELNALGSSSTGTGACQ